MPEFKKKRSPSYPNFGLEDAITRIKLMQAGCDEHPVSVETVAEVFESKTDSSSFQQAVSTLKQFGLLDEEGKGESRRLKVSDLALDILHRSADPNEQLPYLKQAALSPKIHAELWQKYSGRLPSSDSPVRVYLVRERPDGHFNASHVDRFIGQFRATIAFAKLTDSDKISVSDDGRASVASTTSTALGRVGGPKRRNAPTVKIGDFVQWTCNGVDQFEQPVQVVDLPDSDEGEFALVAGSSTGLPVEELTVVIPAEDCQSAENTDDTQRSLRKLPSKLRIPQKEEWAGPKVRFDLPRGNVIEIRLKSKVNSQEFQKIKKIFDLSELAFLEDDNSESGEE